MSDHQFSYRQALERQREYAYEVGMDMDKETPMLIRLKLPKNAKVYDRFQLPFDLEFDKIMQSVGKQIANLMGACFGYQQDKGITLVFSPNNSRLGYDKSKLETIAASNASIIFDRLFSQKFPELEATLPFTAVAWNLPNEEMVIENVIMRESNHFYKFLTRLVKYNIPDFSLAGSISPPMLLDALEEHGINIRDYPICFKRATYYIEYCDDPTHIGLYERCLPKANNITNLGDVIFRKAAPIPKAKK